MRERKSIISIFEQSHKDGIEWAEDALKNHQICLDSKSETNEYMFSFATTAYDLKEALVNGFEQINASFPTFEYHEDRETHWLNIYDQFQNLEINEY